MVFEALKTSVLRCLRSENLRSRVFLSDIGLDNAHNAWLKIEAKIYGISKIFGKKIHIPCNIKILIFEKLHAQSDVFLSMLINANANERERFDTL